MNPLTQLIMTAVPANSAPGMLDAPWVSILINWAIACAILVIGIWLAKRVSQFFHRALARAHVEITLCNFLRNVAYAFLIVIVVISALQKIGVPMTSLAAVIGTAGLAVGLSLKDSLSNIAAGVMLIILRPMHQGDWVVIAGQEGIIEEIRIFQTRLRTFDERLVTLPNSTITSGPIINYTTLPTRRLELSVGVSYLADLKQARQRLIEVAKANSKVLKTPEPLVLITNLAESTVDLLLLCYANNSDFSVAKSELLEQIRNTFAQHGIQIPYPQRDLHVYHHEGERRQLTDFLQDDSQNRPGKT